MGNVFLNKKIKVDIRCQELASVPLQGVGLFPSCRLALTGVSRICLLLGACTHPCARGCANAARGRLLAQTTVVEPRLSAVMLGQLIKGLGVGNVVWGTDAIWTGAPQWQIEALRRVEIPEDIQRKYGYAPLGPADGLVKNAIFGENNARIYNYKPEQRAALAGDQLAYSKALYDKQGGGRTNMAYGFVNRDRTA